MALGVLRASRGLAERFRRIIREQFVRMPDEHDVLAEVLPNGLVRILGRDLPEPPERGSLDGQQVLGAEFAFA